MNTTQHVEPITDRNAAAYTQAIENCPAILHRLAEKAHRSTSPHAENAAAILAACIPTAYRNGTEHAHTADEVERVARAAWHQTLALLKKRAARTVVTDAIRHGLTSDGLLPEGDSSLWQQEAPRADAGTTATDADRLAAVLTVTPELVEYLDPFRAEAKRRAAAVDLHRRPWPIPTTDPARLAPWTTPDPAALMSAARSLAGLTLSGARTTAENRKRDSKQARRYNAETTAALVTIRTVADALHTDPNHAATTEPARQPARPTARPAQRLTAAGRRATGRTTTTTTTTTYATAAALIEAGCLPIPSTGTAAPWTAPTPWLIRTPTTNSKGRRQSGTDYRPTHRGRDPQHTEHAVILPAQDAAPATYGPRAHGPRQQPPTARRQSHWTAPAPEARAHWTQAQADRAAALIERPGTLGDSQREKAPQDLPAMVYAPPTYPYPYTGSTRRAHGPAAPAGWIATTKPERTEQESDRDGEQHLRGEATHASTDKTDAGTTRGHKAPSNPRAKRSDNASSIPARAVTKKRTDSTAVDAALAALSTEYHRRTGKELASMTTAGTNAAAGRDTARQIEAMQAEQRATLNAR